MTILSGLLFGPCLFHLLTGSNSFRQIAVTPRMEVCFRYRIPQLRSGREKETSTLLGRTTPLHSRKKLQKKETSAPIPKKYVEYEFSQWGIVKGSTLTETAYPGHAPW